MPSREPKFDQHPGWTDGPAHMVAVGAVHPSEPPVGGQVRGQNFQGYNESVLVYPALQAKGMIELLQMSKVAECALMLRDNLMGRPNKLSRRSGPLEKRNVTWVLCRQDGWFFRPIAAEVGGESVPTETLAAVWDSVEEK